MPAKKTRKYEPKQLNANRRAQALQYLLDAKLGASAEEIARHASLSLSVVLREIRALRSLKHPDGSTKRLVPVIAWERDVRGSASIALYGWGWEYDKRKPRPKSNLEIVLNYQARKTERPTVAEQGLYINSIFALGSMSAEGSQQSACAE